MKCGHGRDPINCGYPKCLSSDGPFEVVTLRKRVIELEKQLTTGYDLVAESLALTQQHDFRPRATQFVMKSLEFMSNKG